MSDETTGGAAADGTPPRREPKPAKRGRHPNHKNHRLLLKVLDEHFKPRLEVGDYGAAATILVECLYATLTAYGVPDAAKPDVAAGMVLASVKAKAGAGDHIVKPDDQSIVKFGRGRA